MNESCPADHPGKMLKRTLCVTYACSPIRGSEPGLGWHRVFEIARSFDTWVICEKYEFEEQIRKYFDKHGTIQNLHFHFVPRIPRNECLYAILMNRFRWLHYAAYNLWQRRAYRLAVRLHRKHNFDVMHQCNIGTFREPGYVWKLSVPFIWGPVGGTEIYPWRFLRTAGLAGAVKECARNIANSLQFKFSRRVRVAARKAAAVVTSTSTGEQDFQRIHGIQSIRLLDVGVDRVSEPERRCAAQQERPLKILWSRGCLEHRGALQLLLLALNGLPETVAYELRILGDGPLRKRWQRLADRFGLSDNCSFRGSVSKEEADVHYEWADIFAFTSLRDTCGTVILEALAHGLPVLCLDHHGAHDVVTAECGVKIAVSTPQDVVTHIRDALVHFSLHRESLEELSRGALERAQEYLWRRNGAIMAEIYDRVLASSRTAR